MEKICDTYILDNTQLLRQRNMITQSPPRPRVLLFYLNLVLFMAKILKFVYNPKKVFPPSRNPRGVNFEAISGVAAIRNTCGGSQRKLIALRGVIGLKPYKSCSIAT